MLQKLFTTYTKILQMKRICYSYIHSVLKHLQISRKIFQSNNIDPSKLLDDLIIAIKSLGRKVLNRNRQIDVGIRSRYKKIEDFLIPHPYLGYRTENKLQEITNTNRLSAEDEK